MEMDEARAKTESRSASPVRKGNAAKKGRRRGRTTMAPQKYGNRSVVVTANLLQTIASLGNNATLQQIADASGMLPSRAQRYLLSMVVTGLIDQHRESGRFELGPILIELGLTALSRIDSVRVASDTLYKLL